MGRQEKAIRQCAAWLTACLGFGWKHSDLDALQALWWRWHDDYGRLLKEERPNQQSEKSA